ncbi:MAG: hypothetical protein QOE94_3658 [Mycobacterium sp.]|jgi:hypothetical protein|nr:hypothetical protein [Mycobacterium sp.]MDT7722647.1 hypothetical protein [Mycobacterium sp.]
MVACGSRVGLRRYCPLLAEAGMTLTEDDAWQQYWLFAVYSWVAVTSTAGMASRWQPLHIGLAGPHGATEACEKLHCVELLEELLS